MNIDKKKQKNKEDKKCPEGKILNPKTNRCIKLKEIKEDKKCPEGKILNPKTNRCIKPKPKTKTKSIAINLDSKANIIKRNVKKFLYPFINRISANIYDRRNYYNLVKKNLNLDNKKTNYCIRFYKYDTNKEPIFRIGDKIILKKQIGSPSENGIVFLSSFRDKTKKLFKFAIKIDFSKKAILSNEMKILQILSKAVLNDKCPHFPIIYDILKCNKFMAFNESPYLTSKTDSKNSLKKINPIDLNIFPKIFKKNAKKNMISYLNELANGDLNYYLEEKYNNAPFIENAIAQICISLMFFNKITGKRHNDAHPGNFLYHKIKSGGYFHYKILNKDYYIENLGYLWVIWDVANATDLNTNEEFLNDYNHIIREFNNMYNYMKDNEKTAGIRIFTKNINEIFDYLYEDYFNDGKSLNYSPKELNKFLKDLLYILLHFNFIKSKKDLKKNDLIINKTPYIITLFT